MQDEQNKDRLKRILTGILRILVLAAILYWFFGRDLDTIRDTLSRLTVPAMVTMAVLGMVYYLLDGWSYCEGFRGICTLSPAEGFGIALLGFFATVVSAGTGSIPAKAFFMRRKGVQVTAAAGVFFTNYILHKLGVIALAACMLVIGILTETFPAEDLKGYLIYGFIFDTAVCALMALTALSTAFNRALHRLCDLLPESMMERKAWLHGQLDLLNGEVRNMLYDRQKSIRVLLIHMLKFLSLSVLCAYVVCMMYPGTPWIIPLVVMSLVMMLSGALPNISGMGGVEFSFELLFGRVLPAVSVTGLLLNYRLANYLFPFLVSVFAALWMTRRKPAEE